MNEKTFSTTSTHLYDPPTEARLLRQLLQRLSVGVVVLSKLSLHHLHGRPEGRTALGEQNNDRQTDFIDTFWRFRQEIK